jgi:hypothetical protein
VTALSSCGWRMISRASWADSVRSSRYNLALAARRPDCEVGAATLSAFASTLGCWASAAIFRVIGDSSRYR